MHIIWKGHSCFQILTNPGKGEQISIIIDPFSEEIGLRPPKLKADILLITHAHYDHNNTKLIEGSPFSIEGPGEYEIRGVYIQGIPSFHDEVEGQKRGQNTLYIIEAEEMRLCHLGDLGQAELTPQQLDSIGQIDILMVPVGGVYTTDAKQASKVISQLEPKIIIPMHYAWPRLKIKLDSLDKFFKAMGVKAIEPQTKLLIKKKSLPAEGSQVVPLKI